MTLQPADLDRLEQLAREATPGPWFYNSYAGIFSAAFVEKAENWPLDGDDYAEPARYYEEAEALVASVPAIHGDSAHGRHAADAAYIAALSPAVVSELVAAARLGVAWTATEAVLPEGWRGPWLWPDPEEGPYVADAASGEIMPVGLREVGIRASGPTPAAALLALAEALRGRAG